jgi:hypothetical protein
MDRSAISGIETDSAYVVGVIMGMHMAGRVDLVRKFADLYGRGAHDDDPPFKFDEKPDTVWSEDALISTGAGSATGGRDRQRSRLCPFAMEKRAMLWRQPKSGGFRGGLRQL